MSRRLVLAVTAAAVVLCADHAPALGLLPRYRVRRLNDLAAMLSVPDRRLADNPPDPGSPSVPVILDEDFDPADFDQISVAGSGRQMAYATRLTNGIPGAARDIVILNEGGTVDEQGNVTPSSERVSGDAGEDDQPSLRFDERGSRMAYRSASADGLVSNVWLFSRGVVEDSDDPLEDPNRNVTRLGVPRGPDEVELEGEAYEPSLAARVVTREIEGGIKIRERDARIAFVSTGDLDRGGHPALPVPNPDYDPDDPESEEFLDRPGLNEFLLPQLFLWSERDSTFQQITRHDDDFGEVNRPSISGNGDVIAFESTVDLTPGQANPLDPSQVGNPDGVRQIYLWRRGRGIRQLTWGEVDSFAPQLDPRGRHVFFCSRGDLVPGGNPEGNFEIYRWRSSRSPLRRLRQMTQVTEGHNVLPRVARSANAFVFYSTAYPPIGGAPFGSGAEQATPQALLCRRGKVTHLGGVLDDENLERLFPQPPAPGEPAPPALHPILAGPPAVGSNLTKIHFAINDDLLDGPTVRSSAFGFHLGRATRFARE